MALFVYVLGDGTVQIKGQAQPYTLNIGLRIYRLFGGSFIDTYRARLFE